MRNTRHANNFDLIRLLAALQVTYTHGYSWLKLPMSPLWMPMHQVLISLPGVAIFFGVSGFLISRSYLSPSSDLRSYAVNRFVRIYPGLWVNILVLVAMTAIAGSFLPDFLFSPRFFIWLGQVMVTGSDTAAGWLPPFITYLNSEGAYSSFPSGVLWTLTIELLFYLLVPIIFAKALVKRNLHFATLSGALALSLVAFWHKDPTQGPGYIDDYLWIFLVGAAINIAWPAVGKFIEGKALFWLALYVLLIFTRGTSSYQDASPYAVAMTCLLVVATISFAFTWRHLGKLIRDDISYGIYLWHMPIIRTMTLPAVGWVGGWQWYAVALVATCTIAWIVRITVEKPALALKDRLNGRHFMTVTP